MSSSDAQALQSAIARVAEVFAGMTVGPDEIGCQRCYGPAEVALLRVADAVLPVDLVASVAQETPDHWDDQPAVIRRVLPQLVVVLAQGTASPDMVARGLAAACWPDWPQPQAQALGGFLEAWWTWTLGQETPPTSAREVFESCVTASSSVTPWLELWVAHEQPAADRHLSECAAWWWDDLDQDASPFTCWWGSDVQEQAACRELADWLAVRAPRDDGDR
ncbi:hypothetical protein ABH940_003456 [Streptacidiphilus sp. BW17]|uniref:hypothetical protein n=1 Tax=Streptacidiphilus sp. BW17 TaxID=3156274 RepID=UPI003518A344